MKYTTLDKYLNLPEDEKAGYGIYGRCPQCNAKVFKSYDNYLKDSRCKRCAWNHTYPYSKEPLDAVSDRARILEIAPLCCSRQRIRFTCPECGKEKICIAPHFNENTVCKACSIKRGHASSSPETKEQANVKRQKTCLEKYGVENVFQTEGVKDKIKQTCLEKYGVESASQSDEVKAKVKQTCLEKYGVESAFQNDEVRAKAKQTCLEKYGVERASQNSEIKSKIRQTCREKYGVDYCFQADPVKEKIRKTCLEKYGSEQYLSTPDSRIKSREACMQKYGHVYFSQVPEVKEKYRQTCLERWNKEYYLQTEDARIKTSRTCLEKYGVKSFVQTEEFNKKARKSFMYNGEKFDSSWELYYWIWATETGRNIVRHPKRIEYDFNGKTHYYFPDFEIDGQLVEIKGPHFFDSEGRMINPFEQSMNGLFEAKHQAGIRNSVQFITDISEASEYVNNKYTSDFVSLFNVQLEFPYPNAGLKDKSDPGLIRHFHKSIWEARVRRCPSPVEAWKDKELVREIALNRLRYVGSCAPEDILRGFSVTKKAPKVSVFKPSLAKRLIEAYASEFGTIFDPFSGFSGRMLGAVRTGKKYIGRDLSEQHIEESKQLLSWLESNEGIAADADLKVQDILADEGRAFENTCLFTCSPYGSKETWNENEVQMSCDDWIDVCLSKYKCQRYIFVVDETEKYQDRIVESLENKSHFGTNREHVIVI